MFLRFTNSRYHESNPSTHLLIPRAPGLKQLPSCFTQCFPLHKEKVNNIEKLKNNLRIN